MLREEEIEQAADTYADQLWKNNRVTESTAPTIQEIFIAGAELADAHQPSPWISVEDRLPEEDLIFESVVVKLKGCSGWYRGLYTGTIWHYTDEYGEDIKTFRVTHWMPIPELLTTK